jgi:hypothetical protein
MTIHAFVGPGAFGPEALAAMSEAYDAALTILLMACAKPSPGELLPRQDLVNVTLFVCGKPRSVPPVSSALPPSCKPRKQPDAGHPYIAGDVGGPDRNSRRHRGRGRMVLLARLVRPPLPPDVGKALGRRLRSDPAWNCASSF